MSTIPRHTVFLFDDLIPVLRRQKEQLELSGSYTVRAFNNAFLFMEAVQTGTLEFIPDLDHESGAMPDMFVIDIAVGHNYAFPLDQTYCGETEGIRIAHAIRHDSKYDAVPIILISGYGEPHVLENGRLAAKGMDPDLKHDSIFVSRKNCPANKLPSVVSSYFNNKRKFPSSPVTCKVELTIPFGVGKIVISRNH